MAGRKPKLNWTPCYDQYTVTIKGTLHRLGQDEEEAQKQLAAAKQKVEDLQEEGRRSRYR